MSGDLQLLTDEEVRRLYAQGARVLADAQERARISEMAEATALRTGNGDAGRAERRAAEAGYVAEQMRAALASVRLELDARGLAP